MQTEELCWKLGTLSQTLARALLVISPNFDFRKGTGNQHSLSTHPELYGDPPIESDHHPSSKLSQTKLRGTLSNSLSK